MSNLGTATQVEQADSTITGAGAGAAAQIDAQVDAHSIRARQDARDQIANDVDTFLNDGGRIESLEANLRVDLPRKPQNNYGKGSL